MRQRLGEGGEGAGDGGALLEEDADGEQGHARALSLERQVEALLRQRTHANRLHVRLPLSAATQQEVSRHRVHLQDERRARDPDRQNLTVCVCASASI